MGGGDHDFADWGEMMGSCYLGRENSMDKGMEVGEHRASDSHRNDYGVDFHWLGV